MRSAADFETPNSGATCRNVRFVRQYVATSLANCTSVRPANGSIHFGSSAEIQAIKFEAGNYRRTYKESMGGCK